MAEINGTNDGEPLNGTSEDDVINGLGGNDIINGDNGDDTIDGGDGDDTIDGGSGNDTLIGGEGNDFLIGGPGDDIIDGGNGADRLNSFGGVDVLIGGAGNDQIRVENSFVDQTINSSVDAGDGDDEVRFVGTASGGTIDLGSGNDTLEFGLEGTGVTLTLGSGIDRIRALYVTLTNLGSVTITDFTAGDGGDVFDLSRIIQFDLFNYDGFSNPFGSGHFRLEADGTGSVLHIHPDPDFGATYSIFFANVAPSQFTAANFAGVEPDGVTSEGPPIIGTNDPETIDGTDLGETIEGRGGNDIINGLGGDDTLIGGEGVDTLNGGDGDDVFLYDLSFGSTDDPLAETVDGGAGTDTVRVIGSNQGNNITTWDLGSDLPFVSIEGLELSGNFGLIGTVAQINAYSVMVTPNLRVTDNAPLDPTGRFEVTQLSLPNGGATADLSGPNIFVLNIVSGDGDDNIIGPDGAIANPSPNQTDIQVGIDVRLGNDTVVVGAISTRVLSSGGNNNITGGAFDDYIQLSGDGDNFVRGGGGDDRILIFGNGTVDIDGGDGDDVIEVFGLDNADSVAGGAGFDTLIIDTGNGTTDYDLTQVTISPDFEVLRNIGQRTILMSAAQINSFDGLEVTNLAVADGGVIILDQAQGTLRLSNAGNEVFVTGNSTGFFTVNGGSGNDRIGGGQGFNILNGFGGDDSLFGGSGEDVLFGGDGVDYLVGGDGDDSLDGGENVDTAFFAGGRNEYTITQPFNDGQYRIEGPTGIDTLTGIEFAQFGDGTVVHLRRGPGVSVNFETADPNVYQSAMNEIRDFDGNFLGGNGFWLRIGSADINGDGDIDQILVNDAIGRFATVGMDENGLVYFNDHSWAGETRIAGIYIDPLVQSGQVQQGSEFDSQRRFQNDLQIENINRVLGANDYDGDGIWEVYFALTDGTAYLRALMHEDGNIRYANYQSEQEVIDYLTANGFGEETFGDWFPSDVPPAGQVDEPKFDIASVSLPPERVDTADGFDSGFRPIVDPIEPEFFG